MSGIGGMVVTGMAMGVGSEVGHQAVRAMMGSGSSSRSCVARTSATWRDDG